MNAAAAVLLLLAAAPATEGQRCLERVARTPRQVLERCAALRPEAEAAALVAGPRVAGRPELMAGLALVETGCLPLVDSGAGGRMAGSTQVDWPLHEDFLEASGIRPWAVGEDAGEGVAAAGLLMARWQAVLGPAPAPFPWRGLAARLPLPRVLAAWVEQLAAGAWGLLQEDAVALSARQLLCTHGCGTAGIRWTACDFSRCVEAAAELVRAEWDSEDGGLAVAWR